MELEDLNKTFKDITTVVPTIVCIGRTAEGDGMMMMNSKEEGDQQREEDLSTCIAAMMQVNEQVRNLMLASVCFFLQQNPSYQQKMTDAIKLMQVSKWN